MTNSIWAKNPAFHQPLTEDLQADIVIVGAGISGLTTAYALAEKGLPAVVLDKQSPAEGETHYTSAHLASVLDDRFVNIEKWHGEDGAKLAYQSHSAAIATIEKIASQESIDCDFRRVYGYLWAERSQDTSFLQKELEAARRAGHREASWQQQTPLHGLESRPCLCFPDQAQFEPSLYMQGLLRAVQAKGVKIYTDVQVTAWGKKEGEIQLKTSKSRKVRCAKVVFACNEPFVRFRYFTLHAPYRTYMLGFRLKDDSRPEGLYWDTIDPYHYIRFIADPKNDGHLVMIVGGEDHKTGQDENATAAWTKLEAWTRAHFPQAGAVTARWSGQVLETMDGLAFIGPDATGDGLVYLLSGDSGMGLTHGTCRGFLIADLISGTPNPFATLYDPNRFRWRAFPEYLKENLNVLVQYGDYLKPGAASARGVPVEKGIILQKGLKKVARINTHDVVHECNAICPHLGGVVQWNEAEQTWDCPCHGSRFSATGDVLIGPATQSLKKK